MKPATAQKDLAQSVQRKRNFKSTPLNDLEKQRLDDLVIRFQKIVVKRNEELGERARADVDDVGMIRAGLIRLEAIKDDDEFYDYVRKGQKRE